MHLVAVALVFRYSRSRRNDALFIPKPLFYVFP